MPNTSIPAAAEGMSEIHTEKRIAELAAEISELMDRKPHLGNLTIYPSSQGQKPHYFVDEPTSSRSLTGTLIKGIDALDEARAFLDLINFALDSLSGDQSIATEINALQQGMSEVGKRVSTLKQAAEEALDIAKNG